MYQGFPQGPTIGDETAKSLINCFDYCNSLLAGIPQVTLDRLQRVMNS